MAITADAFNANVRLVQETIRLSAELQDSFAREMSLSTDEAPASVFGMVYNTSILNLELLDHYVGHWRREDRSFGFDPATTMENEEAFINWLGGNLSSSKTAAIIGNLIAQANS